MPRRADSKTPGPCLSAGYLLFILLAAVFCAPGRSAASPPLPRIQVEIEAITLQPDYTVSQARFSRLKVSGPRIRLFLPQTGTKAGGNASLLSALQTGLLGLAQRLDENGPSPIRVENGEFSLVIGKTPVLRFSDIQGEVFADGGELAIGIQGAADFGKGISLDLTHQPSGPWKLAISAEQLQVDGLRQTCRKLLGPDIRLFAIVKGGELSRFSLNSQAEALAELFQLTPMRISGHWEKGRFLLPISGLNLSELRGKARLSQGILTGEKLSATLNQTATAKNGKIEIGLGKSRPRLFIQAELDADLPLVKAVLKRLIADADFQAELGRFQDIQGRAKGSLTVKRKTDQGVNVIADVENLRFSGRYQRLSHRLSIRGGGFYLDEKAIRLGAKSIESGPYSLGEMQAELDRRRRPRRVKIRAKRFGYQKLVWQPFHADLEFAGPSPRLEIIKAAFCQIPLAGTIRFDKDGIALGLQANHRGSALKPLLVCLSGQKAIASGSYHFQGRVQGKGRGKALIRSLNGNLALSAQKGRINRFGMMAKLLSVINLSGLLDPEILGSGKQGFAYKRLAIQGKVQNGGVRFSRLFLDAKPMKIGGTGEIGLINGKMDLVLLVAPLKTVDSLWEQIPVLSDLWGENLVSIPVRVSGTLADPRFIPLDPSAIGSSLLGRLKGILGMGARALKLISPFE